ncbi:hypothetical protein TWF281_011853 [Arthrobotrys megalospora]
MNPPAIPSGPKRTTATKIDASTWATYKEYIRVLYIDLGKTLEQVRETLENELGFKATKAQYHHMIYEVWKLRKTLSRDDAYFIEAETSKRKREGKETIVKVAGRTVQEDELKRKKAKYHFSELERHQRRLANNDSLQGAGYVPIDIELVTPSPVQSLPSPAAFHVSPSGEWIESTDNALVLSGFNSPSPHGGVLSPAVHENSLPFMFQSSLISSTPTMRFDVMFETQVLLSSRGRESSSDTFANAQNNSVLRLILSPEPVVDPEAWMTKVLAGSKGQALHLSDLMVFLKSYMIRISNKIDDWFHQRRCMDLLLKSGHLRENARALEMIIREGEVTAANAHTNCNSSTGSKAAADPETFRLVVKNFAVELLYSAARTGDMEILKLLINLGILKESIDERFESETIGVTAAQFAIEYQQEAALNFLLSQKINVNRAPVSEISPALLWTAVLVDSPSLISNLIEHGAEDYFYAHNPRHRPNLLAYLERLCDDGLVWARNIDLEPKYSINNALKLSVVTGRVACFRALAKEHAQDICDNPGSYPSSLLPAATKNKDYPMMMEIINQLITPKRLIDDRSFWAQGGRMGSYTALSCAIANRDIEAMKILLDHGADPQNVGLEYFEVMALDLEYIFEIQYKDVGPSFRDRLEDQGLFRIIDRIEELISQKRAQTQWDSLFSDSSDEEADDNEIAWFYSFPRFDTNLLPIVQNLTNALFGEEPTAESKILRTFLDLTAGFFEHVCLSLLTSASTGPDARSNISLRFEGTLFNQQGIDPFISKIFEAFDSWLWEPAKKGTFVSYVSKPKIVEFGFFSLSCSKKRRGGIEQMIKEYGQRPRDTTKEPLVVKLDTFCFELELGGRVGWPDYRFKYVSRKATKLLLNLEKNFGKYGNDLRYILEWSRCIPDKSFHKRLCDIAASHISELDHQQLASLLKLAVYGDFYETVESIFSHDGSLQITGDIICEATYFAGVQTFTRVFDRYITSCSPQDLEIPLVIAIFVGNLYKVAKLVSKVDINFEFGYDTTAVEAAVALGRLDITTALLEAGASKNLDKAQQIALEKGHFTLHKIITKAIESKNGTDNGSTTSDSDKGHSASSPKDLGDQFAPDISTSEESPGSELGDDSGVLSEFLQWANSDSAFAP